LRQEEQSKTNTLANLQNGNMLAVSSAKFEKEFCRELPESLVDLSNYIFDDTEMHTYLWMPSFVEDVKENMLQNEILAEALESESDNEFAAQNIQPIQEEQEKPKVISQLEQGL